MTALIEQPPAVLRDVRSAWAGRAEDVAVGIALLYWATGLVWGVGGRAPHRMSIALVLVAIGWLVVRPWLRLPLWCLTAGAVFAATAFLLPAVAPTGLDGSNEASSWVLAVALGLLVAAWAGTSDRRKLALGIVIVSAGMELAKGLLAWWAGGTADRLFIGTFYWHNQAGIFLAVGAVLALGALTLRVRGIELAGWVVFPLCAAGTKLTTSRASQLALLFGAVVVLLVAISQRRARVAGTVRWFAAGGLGLLAYRALTSSLLFADYTGRTLPSRDQTIGTNAQHRLDFWNDAWNNLRHWPLSGTGFHGFGAGSRLTTPHESAYSAYAHNGFLQVLSDGGLLFGLPVLAAVGLGLVTGVRLSCQQGRTEPTRLLALVAVTCLLLHVGVDFDWAYPALVALTALLLAVASAPEGATDRPYSRGRGLSAVVLLSLIALAAFVAWGGILHANLPLGAAA